MSREIPSLERISQQRVVESGHTNRIFRYGRCRGRFGNSADGDAGCVGAAFNLTR